jgi:hypothetical protein
MWLQRGEVPVRFRSLQHIGGVLLNVASSAELRYRDNDLDLSQFIGFTQHETLMIYLEGEAPKKVTGTVIGIITPRSASMYMSEIAKGRLSKEVIRTQAHHYIVVPDIDEKKLEVNKKLNFHFYKKLWAVQDHQPDAYCATNWGEFVSHLVQKLFRMDHPTDRSAQFDAIHVLEEVMGKVKGE